MKFKELMKKTDLWLREQNHERLKRKAEKLELDAKFAKANAPYKSRINEARAKIKANTPKKDPLDMSLEI